MGGRGWCFTQCSLVELFEVDEYGCENIRLGKLGINFFLNWENVICWDGADGLTIIRSSPSIMGPELPVAN